MPGSGAAGDGDVPLAPGVLGGAALPVVDVDVAADDRAAGVAGVERVARAERVGGDVLEALKRDHVGVDRDHVRGLSGGEVEAGGGDRRRRSDRRPTAARRRSRPTRPTRPADPVGGGRDRACRVGCRRRRAARPARARA